jgi:flagellar FliL protein
VVTKTQQKASDKEIDPPKTKKTGALGKLVLPITLAITSFCTVYFLPRDIKPTLTEGADQHSALQTSEDFVPKHIATSFVTLEPFTVSIKGRSRILRLGITLEIPEVNISEVDADNPKLRDAFMGYLSVLDMQQVEDAAFLVGLRAQLTRRAKFVLGDNNIQNILITDFMVR